MAGRIVQMSSTSCASTVLEDSFSASISVSKRRTRLQIASATIRAWSWNSMSSSMIGEEVSWNLSWDWLAMVGVYI